MAIFDLLTSSSAEIETAVIVFLSNVLGSIAKCSQHPITNVYQMNTHIFSTILPPLGKNVVTKLLTLCVLVMLILRKTAVKYKPDDVSTFFRIMKQKIFKIYR